MSASWDILVPQTGGDFPEVQEVFIVRTFFLSVTQTMLPTFLPLEKFHEKQNLNHGYFDRVFSIFSETNTAFSAPQTKI